MNTRRAFYIAINKEVFNVPKHIPDEQVLKYVTKKFARRGEKIVKTSWGK